MDIYDHPQDGLEFDLDLAPPDPDVNLGLVERGVSVTLGAALLAFAFSEKRTTSALLGLAGAYLGARGLTGHCALYEALDVGSGPDFEDERLSPGRHGQASVEVVLTISCHVSEVYSFWRELTNLPRFMEHVLSVVPSSDTRSRWRAEVPGVGLVEWEAEIIADRKDELIAWRSLPGSEVHHSGAVQFRPAPGDRGTEVRVSMEPFSRGGRLSRLIGRIAGWGTEKYVTADLRRLRQILEAGEVATTSGQPSGRETVVVTEVAP